MFQRKLDEKKTIFTFVPKLDTATCFNRENELLKAIDDRKSIVVFDLSGVEYISSCFLRICIMMAKDIGASNFRIINTTPNVKKVFKIAGFDQMIEIS